MNKTFMTQPFSHPFMHIWHQNITQVPIHSVCFK